MFLNCHTLEGDHEVENLHFHLVIGPNSSTDGQYPVYNEYIYIVMYIYMTVYNEYIYILTYHGMYMYVFV